MLKLKEFTYNSVVFENDSNTTIEVTIHSSAWTYRYFVEIHHLGSFYCSDAGYLNIILQNLERPEVEAFISASQLSNWVTRRILIEDLANRIRLGIDLDPLFGKLARCLYYAFYRELYDYGKPEIIKKYLAVYSVLEKYSISARKWKLKLMSINPEVKLQQYKMRQLAKKVGRKEE
jgi:hypothetical protein